MDRGDTYEVHAKLASVESGEWRKPKGGYALWAFFYGQRIGYETTASVGLSSAVCTIMYIALFEN